MNAERKTAIIVGVLYIFGTVFGILAALLIGGLLPTSDLTIIASDRLQITGAAFLVLLMGLSLSAMSIFLYPILKKGDEALALGVVMFRGALEGAGYMLSILVWLFLLALSQMVDVQGVDMVYWQSMADMIIWVMEKLTAVHTLTFITGAILLYTIFYRTKLIPRWLSIWGLIGTVPYITVYLLKFFDVELNLEILTAPLGLQEMVMAVWLIVKGFNSDALKEISS